jgi:hypothetical protein
MRLRHKFTGSLRLPRQNALMSEVPIQPSARRQSGWPRILALPMLLAVHLAPAQVSAPAAGAPTVDQRGRQLSEEVTATFQQLRADGAIKDVPHGGNDVTALVLKYVPVGTTAAAALAVLKAAGYQVGTTSGGQSYARANLGGEFMAGRPSGLEITFSPAGSGQTATVKDIHGLIFKRPNNGDAK